jgi:transposase InsO family protein
MALSERLTTDGPVEALRMALEHLPEGHRLIHHSDRSTQYCCCEYVSVLKRYGVRISMTESDDPRNNAIAERINNIEDGMALRHGYDHFGRRQGNGGRGREDIQHRASQQHREAHAKSDLGDKKWKNYYKIRKEDCETIGKTTVLKPQPGHNIILDNVLSRLC